MSRFRHPCTGKISAKGFGAFLEESLGASRQNLQSFAAELGGLFDAPRLTLVNSGSSANLVAALALAGLLKEQGKPLEAVAAAYTFPTTLSSLLLAGFAVRLLDTEEKGFNLCPQALENALAEKPAALVCVTHFLGFPARMDKIMPIARAHGALVLQDACETMDLKAGAGAAMHSLGDLTTWSFYHPHHFSSYGGGAVLAADDDLWRLTDSIAHWGRACTCHIDPAQCAAPKGFQHNFTYMRSGVNVQMSELNAAFGRFQLQNWAEMEARRKENYDILYAALSGVAGATVYPRDPAQGSPFVFPVTCRNAAMAKGVMTRLEESHSIECRSLMGGAMVDQPAFRHIAHDGNARARAMDARSFFLGIHQTLPRTDIEIVAARAAQEIAASQHAAGAA
jgi:CDP-6-deoxy-D-xylo-4-hexulose-3-dehydrase